ncbi:MAG: hypothetical protein IKW46_09720 [Bacteroidaceae bacterium]|nr:hypothetical protein [Bacteroidaceae bacterium]
MKKKIYMLSIILLMVSITTACTPENDLPGNEQPPTYENRGEIQLPMSIFLNNIPAEYAAFKNLWQMPSHNGKMPLHWSWVTPTLN